MPQQTPTVSVIMPVCNCAAFVAEAVQSILNQTEPDFELIVVDDGSTDGSDRIVAKLAQDDCRIRLFKQSQSGKPANARNTGGRHARGLFIAFQDADDLAHADKFRRELQVFASIPAVDVVFGDLQKFTSLPDDRIGWLAQDRFVSRAGSRLRRYRDNVYLSNGGFYGFMSAEVTGINVQTAMIRRAALDKEPYWFDENFLVGEDADLFFRLAKRCQVVFINEVLAYYRQRPDSVSRDPRGRLESEIRVYADNLVRAQYLLTAKDLAGCRRQVGSRYRSLGYLHYVNGEMAAARRAYVAAMRLEPRLSAVIDLLKTWGPPRLMGQLRNLRRACRGMRVAHKQS